MSERQMEICAWLTYAEDSGCGVSAAETAESSVMDIDLVSDVLRTVRMHGAIFFDVEAYAPFVSEAPHASVLAPKVFPQARHLIEYHIVTEGQPWACVVDSDDAPERLSPGSVVVFPHGDAHVLSSEPGMRSPPDLALFERRVAQALPYRVDSPGDGDDRIRLICGFLGSEALPFNPLIQALPRCLHVADAYTSENGWLKSLIDAILREAHCARVAGASILSKLSELVFIEAVRRHVESQAAARSGWFQALGDPVAGGAIRRFHADPARAWNLDDLAREIGTSRTILVERFNHCMNMPPITYLSRWRMQVAAGLLAGGSRRLARIAEDVGYESETSFSRAFKRVTGMPPSRWRSQGGCSLPARDEHPEESGDEPIRI
ncbi:MAG: AraC family transcriptional regulator [Woeseia sp.]